MARNSERPDRFVGHQYPQIVPDPAELVAGSPAPWAGLDSSAKVGLSLDRVRAALGDTERLFTTHPQPEDPEELAIVSDGPAAPITRRSAVLVGLFEEDGEAHVILTRRAQSLRNHKGEVALPGGRSEEGETPTQTALRETEEEVGVDRADVAVVGWLSPLVSFASGSAIWPVVGFLPERPVFRINEFEVDRVFTVSLKDLVAEGAFLEERWRRDVARPGADADGMFSIYFFKVPDDLIWGATGRILTELLCVVTGAKWPGYGGP